MTQLRRAVTADLDAIMAIETATFVEDAWAPETMAAELESEHTLYLVAEQVPGVDGIAGYAGLMAPRGAGQGDIQTIAVVPAARRSGLGRALMLELLTEARARAADEVFLEVRADNAAAQSLYLDLGFEQIAVRPGYYPGGIDALIMRRSQ
ncbi:MAG TPA: ribosomal protein S18-alanine N-acetyltransferase [Pseudolysinimonas sp.]|nr:ribosomal protein S18-alanine N-acetyltransferase [Pseudolysinimonas sp.]